MPGKAVLLKCGLFVLLAGAILLIFIAQGSRVTEGKTITVDDDGEADFETLRDAVLASEDGDTIQVWEGEYPWTMTEVNKTLEIIGNGSKMPVVKGLEISKENILIENLSFTRMVMMNEGSDNLTIRNCLIAGGPSSIGVYGLSGVKHVSIMDCSMQNFSISGINADFRDSRIVNCLFENCSDGIWGEGKEITIRNCVFRNNTRGVLVEEFGRGFVIVNCTFERNEVAICYSESTGTHPGEQPVRR